MTVEGRLWLLAFAFLGLFGILGFIVVAHKISGIDLRAGMFRGELTPLAILFTKSGRAIPLLVVAALTMITFALLRRPLWVPAALFASQVASQTAVEIIKRVFRRARPEHWIHRQEFGLSYPSGHATTAIVFYGTWFLIAFHAPMAHPLKLIVCVGLLVWMAGIDWSRMALGAHYFSDILGGTLFGCAWMCALLAILLHFRIPLSGA